MEAKDREQLAGIQNRLDAFRKHRNDSYAYDEREIQEVSRFYANAAQDIEFLLNKLRLYTEPTY